MENKSKIPSYIIAINAKMKWEGKDIETAIKETITLKNGEDALKSVYAINSVNAAISSISNLVKLDSKEQEELKKAIYDGPESTEILKKVSNKIDNIFHNNIEEFILKISEEVHNDWVKNNSDEQTFNKKINKSQARQYLPLELIGYNEVESDLLFIEPILYSLGIKINKEKLKETYYLKLENYLKENKITNEEELESHILLGSEMYPSLHENNLDKNVKNNSKIITEQLINNWQEKDKESLAIFNEQIIRRSL